MPAEPPVSLEVTGRTATVYLDRPNSGNKVDERLAAELRDAFDQLYEEGAETPKLMSVGLHPRIVGRPGRARGLARFLDHVLAHDRVWVARRIDVARHWAATFPVG